MITHISFDFFSSKLEKKSGVPQFRRIEGRFALFWGSPEECGHTTQMGVSGEPPEETP
jgi:hypothetical protein